MKIAVGTRNPKKIEAVKTAFGLYFNDFHIEGVDVGSSVSNQPFNEDLKKGAEYRAIEARKKTDADYGIGLEGGIIELYSKYYITSYTAIVDKNGNCHGSHDMLWECPQVLLEGIRTGKEMGDVMDEMTGKENTKQQEGGIGYFTKGKLPRSKAMVNGVIGALIPFLNKEHY